MDRVEWRIREWQMNNGICEKVKFAVVLDGAVRTGTRSYMRAVNRAEKNSREAARELARILNDNFVAGTDIHLTLTYDEPAIRKLAGRAGIPEDGVDGFLSSVLGKGESREQEDNRLLLYMAAEREFENWTKRCRRACGKAGVQLKYAGVTSDRERDKRTGEIGPARLHHHVVVNREAAELCTRAWNGGTADSKALYGPRGDLTDLAEYLIAQVRTIPGKKRYHPSRTLSHPEPVMDVPAKNPDAPLRVPAGCEFIWRSESRAGRPQVIRYYRPPEKRRKKKRKGGDRDGGYIRGADKQAVPAPGRAEQDP